MCIITLKTKELLIFLGIIMLVNFSVTNFLSFNKKASFKMESGRVTKKLEHLLTDGDTGKSLLKFSAMYGKNGAGKTNFIRALSVLKNFVVSGKLPQRAPIFWCRLQDENETLPTDFEISFIADKKLYEYKISIVLTTGIITKEELISIAGNRHTKLFYKEDSESPYVFHHSIKGQNKDIEVLSRTFALSGSPFLFSINNNTGGFFAANPEAAVLQKTYLWFKDTLEVIFPDQPLQETSLLQYEICKDEFAQLLKDFDTGIEEIKLEPVSKEKVFKQRWLSPPWLRLRLSKRLLMLSAIAVLINTVLYIFMLLSLFIILVERELSSVWKAKATELTDCFSFWKFSSAKKKKSTSWMRLTAVFIRS